MPEVARRLVFYISGFDPRGAAYYHGLYQRESARQSTVNGMAIEVGPRRREPPLAQVWALGSDLGGKKAETEYVFLQWDDIARANWTKGRGALFLSITSTFWRLLVSGHYARMARLSRPFTLTAMMPFFQLLVSILLAALAGALVWKIARWFEAADLLAAFLGVAAAAAALFPLLELCEKSNAFWLGRLITVSLRTSLGEVPAIEQRCTDFAAEIERRASAGRYDEILIVGHSFGSELAVRTIARLFDRPAALLFGDAKMSLLTLGQTIPSHALFAGASAFRDDLMKVACAPGLDWVDFSAPPDPACMALVDPVTGSGLQRPAGMDEKPKLLSARFVQLFAPERYAQLKRQKMTMHFMYLLSSDRPGDYDYFLITAGPMTLAERYAAHKSVRNFRAAAQKRIEQDDERPAG